MMQEVFTFFGSMRYFKLHAFWAGPLYSPDGGPFYLLTWMVWCKSSSWWCCFIPSIVLGSAVSKGFYWLGVVYRWLLWLRPGPKTFQWRHPLYSFGVVKSIAYHCILRRCSSHMVRNVGIGWWRILMMMAYTNLVYVERLWNLHSGSLILFARLICIFQNSFSKPLHWYSHTNNIDRNMFYFCIIILSQY